MTFEAERYVTIETFTSPWEAQLARALLEAEGIESLMADEHLVRMDWFVSRAIGGVKLKVRQEDAERAAEALRPREPLPEIDLVTEAEAGCPRCPGCNSDNIVYERWSRLAFFSTLLLLGFPLPVPRHRWICRHCGAAWRGDDLRLRQVREDEADELAALVEDAEALDSTLVTIGRFHTPWEAHLARTRLEFEGLAACVIEERLPLVNLLSGQSTHNRLAVNAADEQRAREILAEDDEIPASSL